MGGQAPQRAVQGVRVELLRVQLHQAHAVHGSDQHQRQTRAHRAEHRGVQHQGPRQDLQLLSTRRPGRDDVARPAPQVLRVHSTTLRTTRTRYTYSFTRRQRALTHTTIILHTPVDCALSSASWDPGKVTYVQTMKCTLKEGPFVQTFSIIDKPKSLQYLPRSS